MHMEQVVFIPLVAKFFCGLLKNWVLIDKEYLQK